MNPRDSQIESIKWNSAKEFVDFDPVPNTPNSALHEALSLSKR